MTCATPWGLIRQASMRPSAARRRSISKQSSSTSGSMDPRSGANFRKVRLEMLGMLRSRLETAVAKGELPTSTDVDGLSRFYLSAYQGMAIQARDGATQAELRAVAAAAMAAWPR